MFGIDQGQRRGYDQSEEKSGCQGGETAGRSIFLPGLSDLGEDGRQPSEDQPHKGQIGLKGPGVKKVFHGKGKPHDPSQDPQYVREECGQAFFCFFVKMGQSVEDLFVDPHGDGQRSAADAWEDVGSADEGAFDDLGQVIHKNS